MNEQPDGGLEVAVDPVDMVKILNRKNTELNQQNTMLEAAVMKLRREVDGDEPQTNGRPAEVSNVPTR